MRIVSSRLFFLAASCAALSLSSSVAFAVGEGYKSCNTVITPTLQPAGQIFRVEVPAAAVGAATTSGSFGVEVWRATCTVTPGFGPAYNGPVVAVRVTPRTATPVLADFVTPNVVQGGIELRGDTVNSVGKVPRISVPTTYLLSIAFSSSIAAFSPDQAMTLKWVHEDQATQPALDVASSTGAGVAPLPTANYTGAWFNSSESGWGLSLVQPSNSIAAAWYTFDASGRPTWYLGTCPLSGSTCTGALSAYTGPPGPQLAATFQPSSVTLRSAGTFALNFTSNRAANFTYTVDGFSGARSISLLDF